MIDILRRLPRKALHLALLLVACGFVFASGGKGSTVDALPPPTALGLATSTHEAYAKYQTINYSAYVTKAGTLTHIIMTLPTGATVSSPRSSSGTVAAYKPGQIIWRPVSPIKVAVGTKLVIPVTGIYYNQAGTTNMWMVASDVVGETLAYATGSFTLDASTIGCQPTGNNYIQAENQKPGVAQNAWKIDPAKFNPTQLAGFANAESYKCGDIAYFKVDAQSSGMATVKVYRMGYYGGAGAREIWSTSNYFLAGKQPAATLVNTTSPAVKNMVDASNWKYNIGIRIAGDFTPGTYLAKFVDFSGHEAYVPFTVRDDTGVKHDYLVQQATTTWQAYNGYGGHLFYSTIPANASRLSFNRPYANTYGSGSGEFLQLEQGTVYQMERQGRDVAYWTDGDFNREGAAGLAARTKTLIIPAHDEYYSAPMRAALLDGLQAKGINLVSFGANQIHREITYTSDGRSFDVANAYGMTSSSEYVKTTFRYKGPQQHEQVILGAQYGCAGHGTVTTDASTWLWTGVPTGTVLRGFINGEADHVNTTEKAYGLGVLVPVPANNEKLVKGIPMEYCRISREDPYADIVARTTPQGTRVFGGSTFAYGCFITKSCPASWTFGPLVNGVFQPLAVSDQESQAAAQIMDNVLNWARDGVVRAPL